MVITLTANIRRSHDYYLRFLLDRSFLASLYYIPLSDSPNAFGGQCREDDPTCSFINEEEGSDEIQVDENFAQEEIEISEGVKVAKG